MKFQMLKLDLEKAEESEIKLPTARVQPPQDPGKPKGEMASAIDLERDKERMLKIRKQRRERG